MKITCNPCVWLQKLSRVMMNEDGRLIIVWFPLKLEQKIIVLLFLFSCYSYQMLLLLWSLAVIIQCMNMKGLYILACLFVLHIRGYCSVIQMWYCNIFSTSSYQCTRWNRKLGFSLQFSKIEKRSKMQEFLWRQ